VGYFENTGNPVPLFDIGFESPAGGMYSTVMDLAKIASLVFRENMSYGSIPSQILDGETIKEWLLPDFASSVEHLKDDSKRITAFGIPWECHLPVEEPIGSRYWYRGKNGAVLGYTSQLTLIPDLQLGVSVLMNGGHDSITAFALAISTPLAALLTKIYEENAALPPLPPDPKMYVGNYVGSGPNWPSFLQSAVANITLVTSPEGIVRLHLLYEGYSPDTSTPFFNDEAYLYWIAQVGAFELQPIEVSCPKFLAGVNQWVPFTQSHGKLSFTIPGSWYGITFTKQ